MKKLYFLLALLVGALIPGVAMACPSWQNTGYELSYSGQQLWVPQSTQVVAGGNVEVSRCRGLPGAARGYFMTNPDFTIYVNGLSGYALEFRVNSNCDSNLLVNTGNANWYYDDDDGGSLNPLIRLNRPSNGRYDIWIGTYNGDYCDSVLTLETF